MTPAARDNAPAYVRGKNRVMFRAFTHVEEHVMRMLLDIKIPENEFDKLGKEAGFLRRIDDILDESKPEAIYYTEREGQGEAIMIINLDDPVQVTRFAEPWLLNFNARVEFKMLEAREEFGKWDVTKLPHIHAGVEGDCALSGWFIESRFTA
jgi:hypothetical protein